MSELEHFLLDLEDKISNFPSQCVRGTKADTILTEMIADVSVAELIFRINEIPKSSV